MYKIHQRGGIMKKLVIFAVAAMILLPGLQAVAFDNEKDAKDFIAKNVNVITDFNRTKGNIAAIPSKLVLAAVNVRYVAVPYKGPKIGLGGIGGGLLDAVLRGTAMNNMKPSALAFPELVAQSVMQNFKPTKIQVLPIESASAAKSYQALDVKAFSDTPNSQLAGLGFGAAWEYPTDDQWKMPGPGLRFLSGGDMPKKLFPSLRADAGADGVMWIQVNILRMWNDEIKIGDVIVDIYAPAKSANNPDVLAFSANIKGAGEMTPVLSAKKEQWKTKEKDKEVEKPVSDYWPLIGKYLDSCFASYSLLIDQGIK